MSRLNQVIGLATAGLVLFQSAAHAGPGVVPLGVPLGVTLGNPLGSTLGTALPFAGGGVLGVAAVGLIAGIFIKRRKR